MTGRLALLVAAAAIGLLSVGCSLRPDDGRWATARTGDVVVAIGVTGQLASSESQLVGPPALDNVWNFKIAFMAGEGTHVDAGQPVLGFDTTDLQRQLEEYTNAAHSADKELTAHRATSRMALKDGELAVAQAESNERKAQLLAQGGSDVVAQAELERARLDLEFARYASGVARRKHEARTRSDRSETSRLESVKRRAEQRVAQLQTAMARMRVAAPIAGTVLHTANWRGERKKVGDSAWRAERLIEIVSLESMRADGDIDEMDASRVAVGQRVVLRLDAYPDIELTGTVSAIEDSVQRRSPEDPLKIVNIEIELVDTADVELRPGMRFRGSVETERVSDVLVVPLEAVFATADGAIVYKRDGARGVATRVELGRRGATAVEIVSGLKAGDEIALAEPEGDADDGSDEEASR